MFAPSNVMLNRTRVPACSRFLVLLVAWLGLAAAPAYAAVWTNAAADHDWFNASNWSPATVPTEPGNIGATLTSTSLNFNAAGATSEFLTIGGAGQLNVGGGDLTYLGDGLIGTTVFSNGAGVVNQSAGAVIQTGGGTGLLIGHNAAGTWNVSGGTLQSQPLVYLGHSNGGQGLLSISGTGVFVAPSVVIGNTAASSGELRYTGGATSSATLHNDLRVGAVGPGKLTLGGSGGVFNLGFNLTFDQNTSSLDVQINSPTSFNTLNAGTVGGNIMMIKTDALGVTGADLNVVLDFDLLPGDYSWTVIDLIGAGQYGVSGVYFKDNYSAAVGPVGFFNGLPDDSVFTVFSTTTNTPYQFRIDYDGGNGNDLVLSTSVVAPEPSSLAIWGCGLALLAYRLRTRRRRALA